MKKKKIFFFLFLIKVSDLQSQGKQVIIVTSGAVSLGKQKLGKLISQKAVEGKKNEPIPKVGNKKKKLNKMLAYLFVFKNKTKTK